MLNCALKNFRSHTDKNDYDSGFNEFVHRRAISTFRSIEIVLF